MDRMNRMARMAEYEAGRQAGGLALQEIYADVSDEVMASLDVDTARAAPVRIAMLFHIAAEQHYGAPPHWLMGFRSVRPPLAEFRAWVDSNVAHIRVCKAAMLAEAVDGFRD